MKDNIDYAALFGAEKGENEQEIAAPAEATEDEAEGVEEQEIAAPAEVDEVNDADEEDSDTDSGTDTAEGEEDSKQSKAERAKYAAARRKAEAERDAAVKAAREEAIRDAQRAMDDMVSSLGMKDPFTGKPIKTKAELDAYRAAESADRREKILKRAGMTNEEYKEFVDNLPEVKEARAAKEQAGEQAARQKVEAQLLEIAKMDPSVKTLADLAKTENYQKVYDMVTRGYDLLDAYKLANFDRVQKATADSTRQAAMNSAAGKSHMSKTTMRGVGAVSVPTDIAEAYRVFDPDITDAEIQKHYTRYAKK